MRVVCANTLTIAIAQGLPNKWAARHTPNVMKRTVDAREAIGLARHRMDAFMDQVDAVAGKAWAASDLQGFLEHVFDFSHKDERVHRAKVDAANTVRELFEDGVGNDIPEVRHTAWAAHNAMTEYIDRHRDVKTLDSAVFSSWFGPMGSLRQRSWDYVTAA